MPNKVEKRETLDELRAEIDDIDCKVHDLLMDRANLVTRIKEVKSLESIATVRPGREAYILRRLMTRHRGNFPKVAVARIWREIIAGITRMEMPTYKVAVYVTDKNQTYWDLARDQFGVGTTMQHFAHIKVVLNSVASGQATIGVVPTPSDDSTDPWWISLMVPDGLKIVYKLPFFKGTNVRNNPDEAATAFAVGRILPDTTKDDRTLLVIATEEPLSRSAVCDLTMRVGLNSSLLTSSQQGDWYHLVEISSFITEIDARIEHLNKISEILRIAIIGSYAEPLPAFGNEK
ncbi:MAG: chorismate mutase [Pseudomonadota bacterium]|nr:chorismate mutase [Pseudomonadota bacterium]